ncbi:B-box zinc finger protein 22 [Dichanthelium oligosanthes]|uniref:B-box zinc finger protein 22 n=1 Tax=Dichanthelium oligosanthes TaxID=888268 RepID=A0A1E5WEM9_9POAL|nr:B-box zinc finger protein 22 [Dichanthelium oligosanthes]
MKIGCDACGRAEAVVLCCADEAALCRSCDAAVHSANRLAGRHSRVALLPSSATGGPSPNTIVGGGDSHPACDICQEKTGYFFCLEDRALLCRPCDVAVHSAGAHVASHRRFLITGVRVGGGLECHHVPGSDGLAGAVVSPSTSSGNGSSSAPSSGNAMTLPDKVRPLSSARAVAAREDLGDQQWPWSEFLVDDDVATEGMELFCPLGVSEPVSSSLTG